MHPSLNTHIYFFASSEKKTRNMREACPDLHFLLLIFSLSLNFTLTALTIGYCSTAYWKALADLISPGTLLTIDSTHSYSLCK